LEPGELGEVSDELGGLPGIEEVDGSAVSTIVPCDAEVKSDGRAVGLPGPSVTVQEEEDAADMFGRISEFQGLPIEDAPGDIAELVLTSPCKKTKKRGPVDISAVEDVTQVYNELRGRLHLFCPRVANPDKLDYAVCAKWHCGTREAPSRNAEFYDRYDTIALSSSSFSALFQPCGSCFDPRTLRKHGWEDIIPDKDELMPDELMPDEVVRESDDEISSVSSSDSSLDD
jgi:hypothetical protein